MSNKTALQLLPLIQPAQAQKHVTHNAALTVLDVLVQTSATSRTLTAPPVGAVAGDCYIVAAGATGDWLGEDLAVAVYNGSFWDFYEAKTGWRVWLVTEGTEAVFDGTDWTTSADRIERVAALGISATADDTNRLTVSADATLLTHAGAGHQLKINKASTGATASLLFQNGFSGRAELGNVGNDDFVLKVSPDGTTFLTGLTVEAATGKVIASNGVKIAPVAGDPTTPQDGDIWYNATTGKLRARQNGATVDLVEVTSSQITDSTVAGRALLTASNAAAQRTLLSAETTSAKGVANGYAGLDATGKVPAGQLPSYVDDVLEFANLASLPGTGESGKIYVTLDTSKTYRWSGSAYVLIAASTAAWSDITGRPTTVAGFGITDAVDLGTAQTITGGKTFTGGVTFSGATTTVDSNFTLQDDADTSKRLQFQLSGITTGTTRTLTVPDASGTVPLLSLAQTWTAANTFNSSSGSYSTGGAAGTVNLGTGATISGSTKTLNIGTAGLAGSTTAITIGSAATGALGSLTINSPTVSFGSTVTSVTLQDSVFTLQDNADATKQARFELSGLTTGTTRSLTLPDANGTLALNTVFTASASGLTPPSGGGTANFLRADGSWAAPAGGGGSAYAGLTGIPAAIDAIDGLTPATDGLAYYTGSASAALTTLSAYGRTLIDDADAGTARATLERQDFATRAAFVTWATGRTPTTGLVMRAGGYSYRYIATGTAIGDLPGWVPEGIATAVHWGADLSGATSAITPVSDMIDYVNGQGGGVARMPAGTYLWPGQLAKQGLNGVILEGDGNVTKILRSGNRTAAAIRFWGGANNRIRRILMDCAGYAGRGFFLGDQYSGIEDCECNNCPDRPFGMNGGGNTTYGLDSLGRTSDDAGFTTPTFFPVGCYYDNCRVTRTGSTAFSQKQMHHSRIQRCTVKDCYSEGITIDFCNYSIVSSNILINVGQIDTNQFPDLDAGTGFLAVGGGGVGGVGIDGSTGARFVKNTIIGVQTTTATRNNRSRVAINFVNNLQVANGCQIEGNYISDAKAGVWLKGTVSGAAGNNFRHVIEGNVFDSIGTAAGTGIAQFGAVWIDSGCTDNVVRSNTQIGGDPLITGPLALNDVDQPIGNMRAIYSPIQMAAQSAEPANALANCLRIYPKKWAEAVVPAYRGPSGQSLALQGAIWGPRVRGAIAVPSATTFQTLGSITPTFTGTATAKAFAATNIFTRTPRVQALSAATAGSLAGVRHGVASITTGDGAGLGGFFFSCRFGCSDAATVSGARQFVGVGSTAAPTNVEPSTLTNAIGVGHGAADSSLSIYYGGSAAQTPIALGASFPANTLSADLYELTLYAPSDATGTVHYRVERINTGDVATGTLSGASTVLPAATTTLSAIQAWRTNNATALAVGLDISHIYQHTDK